MFGGSGAKNVGSRRVKPLRDIEPRLLFLQLGFVKAYDRVEHQFLWQTMHAMGFSGKTIKLVKGLAQGGYAKVHVNEDFTRNIPIQRGVRQSCPLASYLFTLTTQALMDSIREGMNRGSITGIQIKPDLQLVHRLFANDIGFCLQMKEENFREVRKKIAQFELASGALLNVQKSVISPMRDEDPPSWLEATGCIVAAPGERFKYLGLLSGRDIQTEEYTAYVKLKYEKKLKH
ncbi:hypothetical protein R1sor_014269 [Riccia sorocarpa]|uniref:Reverse transcriptase domain-containing protein n=1 Tax=Riccia sorocarpa TaxID=122646 RepID=A0ABD3H8X4_9MARC